MQNIISELKKKVNSLNEKKEDLFKKQDEIRKAIKEKIEKIKPMKGENDKLGDEARNLKKERDKENDLVKELITKIKLLRDKKSLILKKYNIKDPEIEHKRIEALERKIETEALSPSQEKKVMKEINDLKKIFGKNSDLEKITKEIKETSKNLRETKKRADEFHNKLQGLRKDGGYDEYKKLSKEIIILRKKHKEMYKEFVETKKEYIGANESFRDNLKKLNQGNKRDKVKKNKEKKRIDSLNVTKINEMAKEVEDKLKKKEKITTDDLLAFQAQK
ncbi:hypothetical protein J4413_01130 [Candidatus Woesearchaeota archaeon]|nr:hypothetical protein [Candidatus Woesearchaeota archaeon]